MLGGKETKMKHNKLDRYRNENGIQCESHMNGKRERVPGGQHEARALAQQLLPAAVWLHVSHPVSIRVNQ